MAANTHHDDEWPKTPWYHEHTRPYYEIDFPQNLRCISTEADNMYSNQYGMILLLQCQLMTDDNGSWKLMGRLPGSSWINIVVLRDNPLFYATKAVYSNF